MGLGSDTSIILGGYEVWDEGVEENYNLSRSSAVHRIRCAWATRYGVIPWLFNANGYGLPYQYPDASWMYIDDVDVSGEGVMAADSLGGRVSYKWACLRCTYRPFNYAADGTETAALQMDLGYEYHLPPVDRPSFFWTDKSKAFTSNEVKHITIITGTICKSRANVANLDTALIASRFGTTNNSTLFGFAAETLRYEGCQTRRRFTNSGAERWNSAHVWALKSVGWNKHWRAEDTSAPYTAPGWYPYTLVGGTKEFPTADHSALLST